MTASLYRPSLSLVLAHEGGYVNNPRDPGGATNKGITQAVYDAYRKVHGQSTQSVKQIASGEVEDIYCKQYWKLMHGDDLPAGLDYAVFDFAVNSGIARAIRYLQRLVGVTDDAVIGQLTLQAIYKAATNNEELFIINYCANRLQFLKSLPTFSTFGVGWTRRVIGMQAGVQSNDTGVVDVAVMMARRDMSYVMPASIGSKPNEVAGKAIASEADKDNYPVATLQTLTELTQHNDVLAGLIALSKI